jgi:transposase
MNHVAIDLGGRESQICIRRSDGTIVAEERRPTRSLRKYLAGLEKGRVVVETCAEAFGVADAARETGHEAVVVPATLVRALGVGSRGLKNDVRDARNLSEASCRMASLPSVHIPSQVSRDRKMSCGMWDALVACRTKLINTVRGWLRGQTLGVLQKGASVSFPSRVRKLLEAHGCGAPSCVERQLATIDNLNEQIAAAEVDLETLAKKDQTCQQLMTVPGVGPLTAVRFLAAIDEVKRFPNAHAVQSYIGLTPGENSSSDRKRNTSITKAGSRQLRWTLVQAAWCAQRVRPSDPMVLWARAIAERRGKGIATVALARKLAGILYALWQRGTTYEPTRASVPSPSPSVPTE